MPAAFNNWHSFPFSKAIYLSKDLEFSILESYLKSIQQIFVERKRKNVENQYNLCSLKYKYLVLLLLVYNYLHSKRKYVGKEYLSK